MQRRYDEFYPLSRNDDIRICSWTNDQWSKDGKTVKHHECNRAFRVWNRTANDEPWAMCPKHAPDPREKPRK